MAEDKKTQIGPAGAAAAKQGTPEPRIRPPTAPQQTPNVIVDQGSGAARTEFLDSAPPVNVGSTPPVNTPGSIPPPNTGGFVPMAPLAPGPPVDNMIGQTVGGRYYVQKKLGEGGMGSVYLATHTILEKQVALKVLHGEFARKQDLVERFMQEAKAASRIRHENVIDVSDFGTTNDGLVFFAMELLKGHDLHDEVARARIAGQLLPWSRTKKIFLQICAALSQAHALGIVHRDLKPENVFLVEFLGDPDFVKLLDFGIAKLTEVNEEGRKLTRTGMLFGTPEYMSPEQARGETADHRVDVYAMGCILFQLITTRVPFEAENFMGVLSLHLTEPPPAIPDEVFDRIGAPRELGPIIDRALEKNRDVRWQTIDELANAVRAACGEAPVTRGTSAMKAENMPAPAGGVTTQRPSVTPPPSIPTPVPASPSQPPGALRTQWTGSLKVPEEAPSTIPPPTGGKSKMPIFLGAAIVIAGGAIAAALVIKSSGGGGGATGSGGSNNNVPAPADAAAVQPPAIDAAPVPDHPLPPEVVVRLTITPKNATVWDVDSNAAENANSGSFKVTPSHSLRHYAIRAKGYDEFLLEFVPDQAVIERKVELSKTGTTPPPRVDAGVPLTVDASVAKPDAAVVTPPDAGPVMTPVDAAQHVTPPPPDAHLPDDCPEIPCIKAFPDAAPQ